MIGAGRGVTASPRASRIILAVASCVLLCGCQQPPASTAILKSPAASSPSPTASTPTLTSRPSTPATTPSTTPTATTTKPAPDTRKGNQLDRPYVVNGVVVVSKKHPLSSRFRPASTSPHGLTATADKALEAMSAAARKAGLRVVVRSGYRSYSTQAAIFKRQMATYPSEELARRYNAEPGKSEHQTGLAVDLWDGVTWGIAVSRTKLGRWLWAHAHEYGFILRYPPGKESITGYAYEPWHFRYVGVEHSRKFGANSTKTLEEYLGIR